MIVSYQLSKEISDRLIHWVKITAKQKKVDKKVDLKRDIIDDAVSKGAELAFKKLCRPDAVLDFDIHVGSDGGNDAKCSDGLWQIKCVTQPNYRFFIQEFHNWQNPEWNFGALFYGTRNFEYTYKGWLTVEQWKKNRKYFPECDRPMYVIDNRYLESSLPKLQQKRGIKISEIC